MSHHSAAAINNHMKLYDIRPIFEDAAPLTPKAFPILKQNVSDSMQGSLEKLLTQFREHLAAGELVKSEFNELKYINRRIEEAFTNLISKPYFHSGAYQNLPNWLADIDTMNIAMHTIPGKLKKAEALKKKNGSHEMLDKYIAFMKELMPLSEAQNRLKPMIVAKKAAEVEKKESKEKYTANIMSHDDVKRVHKVLVAVTKELRDDVLSANYSNVIGIVKRFMAQYDPEDRETTNYRKNSRNPYIRDIVAKTTNDDHRKPVTLKDDYKKIAQDIATRQTDDILEHFISKQTAKLAEILVKKDNMTSVKLENAYTGSGIIEGMLQLAFEDGSSFDVNNKIVWAISKLGKQFYRFPSTFHNVKMPNGSAMTGKASEQRMKEEFAA